MTLSIMVVFIVVFFFFKQKTAYEMRISDWSSDVCSSDLHDRARGRDRAEQFPQRRAARSMDEGPCADRARRGGHAGADAADQDGRRAQRGDSAFSFGRVRYRPAARNGTRVAGAGGDGPRQNRFDRDGLRQIGGAAGWAGGVGRVEVGGGRMFKKK